MPSRPGIFQSISTSGIGPAGGRGLAHLVQRGLGAGRGPSSGFMPSSASWSGKDLAGVGVVVHHQRRLAAQRWRAVARRNPSSALAAARRAARPPHMHRGADAGLAFQPDAAPHHLHQPLADDQAQGPEPPNLRVVEASAWVKGWNSLAACSGSSPMPVSRHREMHGAPHRRAGKRRTSTRSSISPLRSVNLTALAGQEIDQHLGQAVRVADQLRPALPGAMSTSSSRPLPSASRPDMAGDRRRSPRPAGRGCCSMRRDGRPRSWKSRECR